MKKPIQNFKNNLLISKASKINRYIFLIISIIKKIFEKDTNVKKNTQEMQIGINIHLIAITILPV